MEPATQIFIGIPTFNRPGYVKDAIESVLKQTFTDYRVVVSDNVSEPGTADAIRRYVEELGDPRFTFHQQAHNIGEYGQGRYFFSRAAGCKYFMILHDDDRLLPTYLETAVKQLAADHGLAYFVANPYIMNTEGQRWRAMTDRYLRRHSRLSTPEGRIDVLETHLRYDFSPISSTLFRYAALVESGFVDQGRYGVFPFESNIYLRLGDIRAEAWFCPRELVAFRFHPGALRSQLSILGNIHIVDNMIELYRSRRFDGQCEQLRRQYLGRLFRARALYALRVLRPRSAFDAWLEAIKTYPLSPRTLASGALVLLGFFFPRAGAALLSDLPRQFSDEEVRGYLQGLEVPEERNKTSESSP